MNKKLIKGGFTLTELLIVILIIALLMAFILPQLLRGPAQARDLQRTTDIGRLATALESYRTSTGSFGNVASGCIEPESGLGKILIDNGTLSAQNFPKDPIANNTVDTCKGSYAYTIVEANGISANGFVLGAKMENKGNGNYDGTSLTGISSKPKLEKGAGYLYVKVSE